MCCLPHGLVSSTPPGGAIRSQQLSSQSTALAATMDTKTEAIAKKFMVIDGFNKGGSAWYPESETAGQYGRISSFYCRAGLLVRDPDSPEKGMLHTRELKLHG